mgnify:CR=1 FL=1
MDRPFPHRLGNFKPYEKGGEVEKKPISQGCLGLGARAENP